jgi:hypothetical protein
MRVLQNNAMIRQVNEACPKYLLELTERFLGGKS